MRLGGPILCNSRDIDAYITGAQAAGYRAVNVPDFVDDQSAAAFVAAAREADLVIAEVGAWSNPISRDADEARQAFDKCVRMLDLAERTAARCCVNITGSRGLKWDGPSPDNLTEPTFDLIVETTRRIIDAVQPKATCFALETMPWAYPDSPESYLRLIEAIDRKAFAVHLDPINLINCPARYYDTGSYTRHCFKLLGPHIVSCHVKDIVLRDKLTVHLDETPIGSGGFDHRTYLLELSKLHPDTPLMMEHMQPDEYAPAAAHLRRIAEQIGVAL